MTTVTVGTPHVSEEDPERVGRRWRTGVLLLIVADAAFVGALLFSYLYLRGLDTEKAWVASGQHTASIGLSWLLAAGVVLSAVAFRWGQRRIEADDAGSFVLATLVALLVLVTTTVGQVLQLTRFPFGVADSAYSSALYTLAGANLVHLLLTAFLGLAMWNRGRRGLYSGQSPWQVRLVGTWWTWVALAAVLGAFTTSFVASPHVGG